MDYQTLTEIQHAYTKLNRLIDAADPAAADMFTSDGVSVSPGAPDTVGQDAVRAQISSMSAMKTRHCITNVDLGAANGDEQVATARGIVFIEREGTSMVLAVDYTNTFVRTSDGWKVKRHESSPYIKVALG